MRKVVIKTKLNKFYFVCNSGIYAYIDSYLEINNIDLSKYEIEKLRSYYEFYA